MGSGSRGADEQEYWDADAAAMVRIVERRSCGWRFGLGVQGGNFACDCGLQRRMDDERGTRARREREGWTDWPD